MNQEGNFFHSFRLLVFELVSGYEFNHELCLSWIFMHYTNIFRSFEKYWEETVGTGGQTSLPLQSSSKMASQEEVVITLLLMASVRQSSCIMFPILSSNAKESSKGRNHSETSLNPNNWTSMSMTLFSKR